MYYYFLFILIFDKSLCYKSVNVVVSFTNSYVKITITIIIQCHYFRLVFTKANYLPLWYYKIPTVCLFFYYLFHYPNLRVCHSIAY